MDFCEKHLPAKLSLLVTYASILQEGKNKKNHPNTTTKRIKRKQNSAVKTKYKQVKIEAFHKKNSLLNKYISSPKWLCSERDFFV